MFVAATLAFVFFFTIAVSQDIPAATKLELDANVAALNGILSTASTLLKQQIDATTQSSALCSYDDACSGARQISMGSGYSLNFSTEFGWSDYDFLQMKIYPGLDTSQGTTAMRDICALKQLVPTWRSALTSNRGDVLYQYYAGSNNLFGVYPALPWNCESSSPYTPTERPYYVAGATGQKDIVILIDLSSDLPSSATRLAWTKTAAITLLDSLSFRDYVAVVPFSEFTDTSITDGLLVQATAANVAFLKARVTGLTLNFGGTDVGGAMRQTLKLMTDSRNANVSSQCTETIVIFGTGVNNFTEIKPDRELASRPDTIVFTVVVAPPPAQIEARIFGTLSCNSKGITTVAQTEAATHSAVRSYVSYYGALLVNNVVRWSEAYVDAFGQGDILSGAFPLYETDATTQRSVLKGMVVMDVPAHYFTRTGAGLTIGQVNQYLLGTQVCEPINPRARENRAVVEDLQGSTCTRAGVVDETASEDIAAKKLLPLWVSLNILLVLICGLGIAPILKISKPATVAAGVTYAVLHIILMSIMFGSIFPAAIRINHWDEVQTTIEGQAANPHRCCRTVNCGCQEASHGTQPCVGLHQALQEGACYNGYHCCRERCRSCNCDSDGGGCQRCCTCVESVRRRLCEVICGTCYRATLSVSFEYKGKLNLAKRVRYCGLDETACKDHYFAENPIGSVRTAWVNPENPDELRDKESLPVGSLVMYILLSLIAWGIPVAGIVVLCCHPRGSLSYMD